MATTNTTTYASTIQTIWKKKLLAIAMGKLVIDKWANKEGIEMKGGKTIRVNRVLRPARQTSARSNTNMIPGDDSTIRALTSNYIDFTPEVWQSGYAVDDDVDVYSFINDAKNQEVIGNEFARTHEYQLIKKLANQGMWYRIDGDSTYQLALTPSAADATTLTAAALSQADDAWIGAQACPYMPSAPAYDEAATVTDSDQSSTNVSVAFTNTPSTASKFFITAKTGIVAGDKMTTAGLLAVAGFHEHLETPKFDSGTLRGVISSGQHADLHADSDWKAYVQYDRSKVVENYKPLRWFDQELLVASEIHRTDADNTENTAGAVHHALIFGKDSYSAFHFGMGSGTYGVEWNLIDKPDTYDVYGNKKFITYKSRWAGGVTRATSCISLLTGATAVGLAKLE